MDGLRLSLIVAGVVIVVVVYLWSARRRRIDREAGSFDRFQSWSDDSVDPLVDDFDDPYERLREGSGTDTTEPQVPSNDSLDDEAETLTAIPVSKVPAASAEKSSAPAAATSRPAPERARQRPRGSDDALDRSVSETGAAGRRAEPVLGRLEGLDDDQGEAPEARIERVLQEARTRDGRPISPPPKRPAGNDRNRRKEVQTELALEPEAPPEPDMVVVLNVMAREGERLEGEAVHAALERSGLRYGEMQAYHYFGAGQPSRPLFSVLNAVKPGTLDPTERAVLRTPGLAMVLSLPGPGRPLEAFETMHGIARQIADELDARLCDSTRSTLTRQAANHLREQIAEYGRRKRLGA